MLESPLTVSLNIVNIEFNELNKWLAENLYVVFAPANDY